ncbi:MAG: SpaA isopeptide-forming pilin-related protein [Peptostreptococcus porci]|uniref:SpaA isopeptide-forming pilin-related protein n=1 Tax=Peptostreptococcus porci TaxID=2652282 RepID=UPI002A75B519|nr:SpaA isopeptide-forming pilin-related protein [Peptostreptococcus porci]MDY2794992.1 SpaA isopeptide-forming pilin-related protein [Peptostreptococcus porci]MDY5478839.1 SpaA isopeptide-forming pilin-related protein [Peptostreptococcus porci]
MKKIKYVFCLLIVASIFTAFTINNSSASDLTSVTITKTINRINGKDEKKLDGIIYGLLKIGHETKLSDDKKKELVSEMSAKSLDDLIKKYDKYGALRISIPTDTNGKTIVKNLEPGTYYVTEIKKDNGKWIVDKAGVPLIITAVSNTRLNVNSKSYFPERPEKKDNRRNDKEENNRVSEEKNERENQNNGSKYIIKTGDGVIYTILGSGIILMAFGYRVYKK